MGKVNLNQSYRGLLKQKKQKPTAKEARESTSAGLGSVSFKLILAFAIPIILILVLGISSYNSASQAIIGNVEESTLNTLNAESSYLALGFKGVEERSLELLSMEQMDLYYKVRTLDVSNVTTKQTEAKQDIMKKMFNFQSTNEFIYNIYLTANVGYGLTTTSLGSSKQSYPDYYSQFIETDVGKAILESENSVGWMDYNSFFVEKMAEEHPKVNVSDYAITMWRKYAFATTIIIIIDVKQEAVDNALKELNFGTDSLTVFIAPQGKETIFAGSDDGEPTKVGQDAGISISGQEYYQKAIASEDKSGYFYEKYNGRDYLFSYSKIGETGALLCTLIPKSVITSQADSIRNLTLIIMAIAIIAALVACFLISVSFGKAVKSSIKSLVQVTKGDLTASFDTKRRDEFGIIARSNEKMLEGIRGLIKEMQVIGTDVNVSSASVYSHIEALTAATKDISHAIKEIESGVTTQAVDAEQCLISMSNLSERINLVYDNTHEIERIADVTKNITGEGIEIMDKLNQTSKATTDITNEIIQSIEDLEIQSQSIGSIISVMNSIASQTNLLSLNASIEAARAGEAGRGFAVVANEIRSLADQSMTSSKKIESIIEIIQEKTQNTVSSARQAESIIETQNEALRQSIEAFQNISRHVENLVQNLNRITDGIRDIESSKTDTLDAIQNISAVSQESASASEEVGATIDNMVDATAKLREIAAELKRNSENMEKAISVFKF